MLDERFVSLGKEAEKIKDMNMIVHANALKRKSEEAIEETRKLEEALNIMVANKKTL